MFNMQRKTSLVFILTIASLGLSACSAIDNLQSRLSDKPSADYQNNRSVKDLEIPPDLTKPEFDKAFELPKGVISAASLNSGGSGVLSSENANAARSGDLSTIRTVSNRSVLQINDTYSRALIMTEIMLRRMAFSTVSKSPSGNVITVKYNGANVNVDGSASAGLLGRVKNVFSSGGFDANQVLVNGKNYLVDISAAQGAPIVTFKRADGSEISNQAHAKIISLLNEAFNR